MLGKCKDANFLHLFRQKGAQKLLIAFLMWLNFILKNVHESQFTRSLGKLDKKYLINFCFKKKSCLLNVCLNINKLFQNV